MGVVVGAAAVVLVGGAGVGGKGGGGARVPEAAGQVVGRQGLRVVNLARRVSPRHVQDHKLQVGD